ncbi:TIGR03546 family protein [Desulfobotulus sp. H1]|uniref:TIGR03546 family protein n=1 Tax=Desulfobotulus pelophilus TaxID=2823377 RepID=A0ABT3N7X5_9BACT|nr:TIGR03546 family protein [Desulfobotulus pelophilus]MCW7753558.1 TIGR03546 family protein [Desulfobotulus pelophilus]
MIQPIASFLKILNSEASPAQISLALCFAMVAGFIPFFNPFTLCVLFVVLVLRVNLSAFLLGWGFCTVLAFVMDPLFHSLGLVLLSFTGLEALWTSLYNIPLIRLTHFNNTVMMGSLVVSFLLFIPLFFMLQFLIGKYRGHFMGWIQKTRMAQIIKGTKVFMAYRALR